MAMDDDFSIIGGLFVRYDAHPTSERAQLMFNSYYGGELPRYMDLFTDETMTDVHTGLIARIRVRLLEMITDTVLNADGEAIDDIENISTCCR